MTKAVPERVTRLLIWSIGHVNHRVLELTIGGRPRIRLMFAGVGREFGAVRRARLRGLDLLLAGRSG